MPEESIIIMHASMPKASLENLEPALKLLIGEMQSQVATDASSIQPLFDLIEQIRPASSHNPIEIEDRLEILIDLLEDKTELSSIFADYMLSLLRLYSPARLYSDIGILANDGFFTALTQRLIWHVIPPMQLDNQVDTLFNTVFYKESDERWLNHIKPQQWYRLIHCLATSEPDDELLHSAQHQLLNALMVISYRITAMGLEPELIRIDPTIDEFESPFMAQNREVIDFVESYQPLYLREINNTNTVIPDENPSEEALSQIPDERPTAVMIEQCRDILFRLRKNTKRYGVSIRLTNLMIRIEQSLTRMELLFELLLSFQRIPYVEQTTDKLAPEISTEKNPADKAILKNIQVIYSENPLLTTLQLLLHEQKSHASIRDLISTNTELIALQVTENASKTGGHYVTDDRKGYFGMLRSAMGAGAIIACMATIKVLLGRVVLAPFIKALTQSMNYSFGFMLIHVLHFTVATKQPAMTAAAIAATVHQGGKTKQTQLTQLADLARLTVNIMRTQFIAIIGNISVAMPIGLLIAYLWQTLLGQQLLTPQKAHVLLHDINPFQSLAIPHAAIAGVCLFLSGLIAGYYDNLAVYHSVGTRLRQHRRLKNMMSPKRLDKVSTYIENNLGALAGNFWFGIMLGSMGTVGYILGLPLDIRHIAFASVNFAQSVFTLRADIDLSTVLISFLGVLMIGMTNLLVSFSLALFVALKARRVSFNQWIPLGQLILGHFFTRPTDFFLPPATPNPTENSPTADGPSEPPAAVITPKAKQSEPQVH